MKNNNNDDFILLKSEIYQDKSGASLLLHDVKNNFNIWIDSWLIDGYGNKKDYKTSDLYIDWEFNQYIFWLENEKDIFSKQYQEKAENIENIQNFLDENNDFILNQIKGEC